MNEDIQSLTDRISKLEEQVDHLETSLRDAIINAELALNSRIRDVEVDVERLDSRIGNTEDDVRALERQSDDYLGRR